MIIKTPVYLALTKPPLVLGVPISFFYGNMYFSVMFFVFSKSLYLLVLGFFIHMMGTVLTIWDIDFVFVLSSYIKNSMGCPNNRVWRANSYEPF